MDFHDVKLSWKQCNKKYAYRKDNQFKTVSW